MSTGVTRLAYAAARVVLRDDYASVPHRPEAPGSPAEIAAAIDWDRTAALRKRLDGLGFGIAEAMDTAQRFSIGWESAERLIRTTGALGLAHGFCAGAGTDHVPEIRSRDELAEAVAFQAGVIREAGGIAVLLPMPWLSLNAATEEDYVATYGAILERVEGPVFVHWLGEMFLPELAGYFPGESFRRVLELDPAKVRGAKLSLLDAGLEVELRRELLTRDQLLLTGDDFHFARLILGGDAEDDADGGPDAPTPPPIERWTELAGRRVALGDFSHALLGILDGIAAPASAALAALGRGDAAAYLERMLPCEELSRHVFAAPTRFYKTDLALLAWLGGLQPNRMLVNHEELARDRAHLRRAAELAVAAGVLASEDLAPLDAL